MTAALRRGSELVLTAFGVSLLSFLVIRLIPGDAVQLMLGANAAVTPAQLAALRHGLGLDLPFPLQYAHWLGGALHGDFGISLTTGQPVLTEIAAASGVTAELTVLGLLAAILLAIPLGCAMATVRAPLPGLAVRLASIVGITLPPFWLGIMALYAARALAPGFGAIGWIPLTRDPLGNLAHAALPVGAIALPAIAALARILRATLQEELARDHVRTARAKGLSEARVLLRHGLRNALLPFTTAAGILAGYLFGGSVVVEQVFALPGLGRLMVGAIAGRDYAVVEAAILLATLAFLVVNLGVDLLYLVLDPRLRR